ncbi:hypothetical protein Peur_001299 [Populus x canadensis]
MLMAMLLLLCDGKLFVLAYTGSAVMRYAVSECCSCFMLVLVCWYARNIRACWKSEGNVTCTDRGTYGKWGFGNRRLLAVYVCKAAILKQCEDMVDEWVNAMLGVNYDDNYDTVMNHVIDHINCSNTGGSGAASNENGCGNEGVNDGGGDGDDSSGTDDDSIGKA